MIKSILPTVQAFHSQENEATWRLFVDANLEYFNGHFPEQAVLPGVTQLDWAIRLGCEHFGYDAQVATLEVLKFQQLLLPDTEVELAISHNPAKQKLSFIYSNGEQRFASGRICLASTRGAA